MAKYRLRKGKFHIDNTGKRLEPGDTIELTKEELKKRNLQDRFELVTGDDEDDTDNAQSSNSADSADSDKFSAISGMTVPEVISLIESLETEEDLELLRQTELSDKKRKGVLDAIDEALEE